MLFLYNNDTTIVLLGLFSFKDNEVFMINMIPKIIWTYWDNPIIPQYIQDCLNTWKIHCKNNWSINILNKNTIKLFLKENVDYPAKIWENIAQQQSDMFGVALVNKYGGIYMDANIIMQKSIDFICEKEWFGYCEEENAEVFLFASYKNSYVINKIHKLFFAIFDMDNNVRLSILKTSFLIKEEYLYPQKLINVLMKTDEIIKKVISENSLPQWKTIYTLLKYIGSNHNAQIKAKILSCLNELTGKIPEDILQQPLLKLQGAAIQNSYVENKNSWLFALLQK